MLGGEGLVRRQAGVSSAVLEGLCLDVEGADEGSSPGESRGPDQPLPFISQCPPSSNVSPDGPWPADGGRWEVALIKG